MSRARSLVSAALLAALAALAPRDAGAQGGLLGRVKQKAAEKAGEKLGVKPGAKPDTARPGRADPTTARRTPGGQTAGETARETVRNDHLLELTPEVLDRLQTALDAEARERQVVAPMLGRTKEDHDKCQLDLASNDPGFKKRYDAYAATLEGNDTAARQRAGQAMLDYQKEKCGEDPTSTTYRMTLQGRPEKAGLAAGGFTTQQYAILKERVPPFCGAAGSAAGDAVRIPGEGANIYWVYTPGEAQALRPRCAALTRALAAVS